MGGLAVAASLAGCRPGGARTGIVVSTDVLLLILVDARNLLTSYERVMADDDNLVEALTGPRDDHAAHVATLARITASGSGPGELVTGDLADDPIGTLTTAETTGFESALDSCVNATPEFTVLLGEIAASRAGHIEALGAL